MKAERLEALWDRATGKLTDATGGPARRRVVLLLAAVLSLQSADAGTVGAVAPQLERAFRLGPAQIGLLVTASSLLGAVAALPMGVLADRTRRVPLLAGTIVLWAASMAATGLASSYIMLLVTRLGLGVVTAAAGPFVASLTGDLFPANERARIYGMILTGELIGAGVGLIISADVANFAGWRAPFFMMAVPSIALSYGLYKLLPEPARGGQSWLHRGDEEIKPVEEVDNVVATEQAPPAADTEIRRKARRRRDVRPRQGLVLSESPAKMAPWRAGLYVIRIPSNLVLIGTSVLGYFFLAGLRAFAVIFAESHFNISQALVTAIFLPIGAGAILGTLGGGRLVDSLIHKGKIDARVMVAGVGFIGASVAFMPGLASTNLLISVPLFTVAAAFLTTPDPALDAARLDVVPSLLWGRATAVRTFGQSLLEAVAPLTFGYVSAFLGGPGASLGSSVNGPHGGKLVPPAEGRGLEYTFLIMLAPLLVSGVVLLFSRHAYLRDVATADLSERKGWEHERRKEGVAA